MLNLGVDAAETGELTAGKFVAGQTNLSVEDRVEQLFEQLREPMVRYLVATFGSERAQAEEITQEAFLQLYRYMVRRHAIDNVKAWTYRVARNIALQRGRQRQFLSPLSDEEWEELQSSVEDKSPNPEECVLEKERLTRLRNALSRLTAVERECLNLRSRGFRYREIAEIVEISPRAVAGTLYRVIGKLGKETNE